MRGFKIIILYSLCVFFLLGCGGKSESTKEDPNIDYYEGTIENVSIGGFNWEYVFVSLDTQKEFETDYSTAAKLGLVVSAGSGFRMTNKVDGKKVRIGCKKNTKKIISLEWKYEK